MLFNQSDVGLLGMGAGGQHHAKVGWNLILLQFF